MPRRLVAAGYSADAALIAGIERGRVDLWSVSDGGHLGVVVEDQGTYPSEIALSPDGFLRRHQQLRESNKWRRSIRIPSFRCSDRILLENVWLDCLLTRRCFDRGI